MLPLNTVLVIMVDFTLGADASAALGAAGLGMMVSRAVAIEFSEKSATSRGGCLKIGHSFLLHSGIWQAIFPRENRNGAHPHTVVLSCSSSSSSSSSNGSISEDDDNDVCCIIHGIKTRPTAIHRLANDENPSHKLMVGQASRLPCYGKAQAGRLCHHL
jgi:hypothetical protein